MARTLIKATNNFTKRDLLNSKSGISLQDFSSNGDFPVTAAAIIEVVDEETGDIQNVTTLVTPDKDYVTSISQNIYETTQELIDIINEEGEVSVSVRKAKSKGGRDFLSMIIL